LASCCYQTKAFYNAKKHPPWAKPAKAGAIHYYSGKAPFKVANAKQNFS